MKKAPAIIILIISIIIFIALIGLYIYSFKDGKSQIITAEQYVEQHGYNVASRSDEIQKYAKTDTITDTVTKEELDIILDPVSSLVKVTINSDSMLNYSSYNAMLMDNNVFLDKAYYQNHTIARGDIVMFQTGILVSLPILEGLSGCRKRKCI